MELILHGFTEAWRLLRTGDADIYEITARTAVISGTSTLIALLIGVPGGLFLALANFRGQRGLVALANAGTGMPPVVAGLIVSILLWRSGLLGGLGLIYTPAGIVIAQVLIAVPIITAVTAAAVMSLPPALHLQIRAMGADQRQYLWLVVGEARLPLLVAVMAGFGAVVSEVGASQMVGGNIAGETRVLTTAAVLEVSRGEFGTALAFGLILVAFIVVVAGVVTGVQVRAQRR